MASATLIAIPARGLGPIAGESEPAKPHFRFTYPTIQLRDQRPANCVPVAAFLQPLPSLPKPVVTSGANEEPAAPSAARSGSANSSGVDRDIFGQVLPHFVQIPTVSDEYVRSQGIAARKYSDHFMMDGALRLKEMGATLKQLLHIFYREAGRETAIGLPPPISEFHIAESVQRVVSLKSLISLRVYSARFIAEGKDLQFRGATSADLALFRDLCDRARLLKPSEVVARQGGQKKLEK